MSRKSVMRTRKIVRHRQFLEDHAKADLQLRSQEHKDAQAELEKSRVSLSAASAWKSSQSTGGGLDLTLYQSALHFESACAVLTAAAEQALGAAEAEKREATGKHLAAINGTNVANARLDRVSEQWRLRQEHALADQVADVWLANKDKLE
jgi:hypothetical protein